MIVENSPLDLTSQQKDTLKQFRNQVSDILRKDHDDLFLLRWLRARDFNIAQAEKMLRESMEWRKQWGADDVAFGWCPPEVSRKYYPLGFLGYDYSGSPVWFFSYGTLDMYGILHSMRQADFIKSTMRFLERGMAEMPNQTAKMGHLVHQQSIILDMDNLPMRTITWKPSIDTILYLMKMYEANYPEVLRKVYILNASRAFTILWGIIKPFLHEVTVKKIHIFGYEKERWCKEMFEDMDPSIVPVQWGGTRTDETGDPRCPTVICPGGKVPEESYFEHSKESQKVLDDLEAITVNKGDKVRLEYEAQPGQALRWIYKTEDHDIGFGIFRRVEGQEEVEELPVSRVSCSLFPEEGIYPCSDSGTYIVVFDNSYSYLRSKKLHYSIKVESGFNTEDEDTQL